MVRKILGVILGYIVLFIGIFILYSAAYFAMGSDTAFKPETYDTTIVWTISAPGCPADSSSV